MLLSEDSSLSKQIEKMCLKILSRKSLASKTGIRSSNHSILSLLNTIILKTLKAHVIKSRIGLI